MKIKYLLSSVLVSVLGFVNYSNADFLENISDGISKLGNTFNNSMNRIQGVLNVIGNVFTTISSIFETILYGLKTLLSGIYDVLVYVFGSGIFASIGTAYNQLGNYIGGPALVVLSTILIIAMVRIVIAFVFKLFRLNIDYHSLQSKTRTWNQHSALDSQKKSLFE